VFEPGDPAALARAIEEARADPAYTHRLAAEGRRRVVEHFGLDRMIDEIEQQLLDTLNQTPSL
jgi:glycosyltransferase involved in cell wall biosynthesis